MFVCVCVCVCVCVRVCVCGACVCVWCVCVCVVLQIYIVFTRGALNKAVKKKKKRKVRKTSRETATCCLLQQECHLWRIITLGWFAYFAKSSTIRNGHSYFQRGNRAKKRGCLGSRIITPRNIGQNSQILRNPLKWAFLTIFWCK